MVVAGTKLQMLLLQAQFFYGHPNDFTQPLGGGANVVAFGEDQVQVGEAFFTFGHV